MLIHHADRGNKLVVPEEWRQLADVCLAWSWCGIELIFFFFRKPLDVSVSSNSAIIDNPQITSQFYKINLRK